MPQAKLEYDLVVIGGGPAGIVAAATAATHRKRVALIDQHRELGGAGANTGTVPSKTLRETGLALSVSDFLRHERSVTTAFNARPFRKCYVPNMQRSLSVPRYSPTRIARVTGDDTSEGRAEKANAGGAVQSEVL